MMSTKKEGQELLNRINKHLGYDIRLKSRLTEVVCYRQALTVFLKHETDLGIAAIGSIVNKHHATVLHAEKRHLKQLSGDTNKSDAYRVAWKNVVALANGSKANEDKEVLSNFTINISLRKKIHNLNRSVEYYQDQLNQLREANKSLTKERNKLKKQLLDDPSLKFDSNDVVKQVDHPWTKEQLHGKRKARWLDDKFEAGGIRFY